MIEVNSNKLYHFFNKCKEVNNELRLNINNGIWYRVVDTSNCIMQECNLSVSDCLIFSEEDKEVGIYLDRILPFITAHKKDGYIRLEFTGVPVNEEVKYKLTMTTPSATFTCDCPSVNIIRKTPNRVSFSEEHQFEIDIAVKELKSMLKTIGAKATKSHSDCIKFALTGKQFTLTNKSTDLSTTITAKTLNRFEQELRGYYSYEFIRDYLKSCDSKSEIRLHIICDRPSEIKEYTNFDNYFLVAPRIENA